MNNNMNTKDPLHPTAGFVEKRDIDTAVRTNMQQ
jgi:hypothetical protein